MQKAKTRKEYFSRCEVPLYTLRMSALQIKEMNSLLEKQLGMDDLCFMPVHYIEQDCEEDMFGEMAIGDFFQDGVLENGEPDMCAKPIYYLYLPDNYPFPGNGGVFPDYRSNQVGEFTLKPASKEMSSRITSSIINQVQEALNGK